MGKWEVRSSCQPGDRRDRLKYIQEQIENARGGRDMPDFGSDESSDEDDEVSLAVELRYKVELTSRENSTRKDRMSCWKRGERLLGIHCQSEHESLCRARQADEQGKVENSKTADRRRFAFVKNRQRAQRSIWRAQGESMAFRAACRAELCANCRHSTTWVRSSETTDRFPPSDSRQTLSTSSHHPGPAQSSCGTCQT